MSGRIRFVGKRRGFGLGLMLGLGAATMANAAWATEYYLAPTGSDSNAGTQAQPFGTIQKAADTAVAGDTVWIRGGTYYITTPTTSGAGVTFTKSGTSDTNRIKYWAYPGETPVFNFSKMTLSTTGYTHGFQVSGSWLHFRGLELCYALENTRSNNAVNVVTGGNDIFELLNMHHNMGNGIFLGKGTGGHLLLNCDAHDNYDPMSTQGDGQNADGFGVHYQTAGAVTTIRGCRAWWNSDDGYDLINQEVTVRVENSWAFSNGYANAGTTSPAAGNGNGFKMGSSATAVRHYISNSVAWKNKAAGFYANHSSGGNTWYNNTSYSNGTQYNMLASPANDPNTTITLSGSLSHIMRNNIGFPNKNTNMGGVDTAFNTWDLAITPATSDFLSVDPTDAMGPRQADGSLPNLDFMKLSAGSHMIDKGTDVGLPFVGGAPDLGAYEYGSTTVAGGSTGSGGVGTGGAQSAGGASAAGGRASGGTSAGGVTAASGGARAAGGSANDGGAIASTGGSAVTLGGAQSQGGSTAVGVGGSATTAAGGASTAAGGAASSATGGASVTAGASARGGAGTAGSAVAGAAGSGETGGGCSCAIVGSTSTHEWRGALGFLAAVLGLTLRRRRRAPIQGAASEPRRFRAEA